MGAVLPWIALQIRRGCAMQSGKFPLVSSTVFLLATFLTGSASATSSTSDEFERLVRLARTIAEYDVEATSLEEDKGVVTTVRLRLLEGLKGEPGEPGEIVSLRVPGGGPLRDGGWLYIPGMPEFTPGERVVLLLRGEDEQPPAGSLASRLFCPVVGGEWGKFNVISVITHDGTEAAIVVGPHEAARIGTSTGAPRAGPPLGASHGRTVGPNGDANDRRHTQLAVAPITREAFIARIKRILAPPASEATAQFPAD